MAHQSLHITSLEIVGPEINRQLTEMWAVHALDISENAPENLNFREAEELELASLGLTSGQAADHGCYAVGTVKTYRPYAWRARLYQMRNLHDKKRHGPENYQGCTGKYFNKTRCAQYASRSPQSV